MGTHAKSIEGFSISMFMAKVGVSFTSSCNVHLSSISRLSCYHLHRTVHRDRPTTVADFQESAGQFTDKKSRGPAVVQGLYVNLAIQDKFLIVCGWR